MNLSHYIPVPAYGLLTLDQSGLLVHKCRVRSFREMDLGDLFVEYPEVFAGAACLSTHWVGANPIEDNPLPQAIFKYMEDHLPRAGRNRIYFDYGNMTLDYYYTQYAPRVDALLNLKGYTDVNSKNLFFEGANHSENAWNSRLDNPLVFLLSPW